MPTITFSIGGPEIDISGKSEKQIVELVKEEYNKKKKIKFIKKKKWWFLLQLEQNTYIVPNNSWDLHDFRVFHYYISKGWIIQDDNTKFMINPEWEGEEPSEPDWYFKHRSRISSAQRHL